MPFRNPFSSKRAEEKLERIKQLEAKEKKYGPTKPAEVNVYKSNQRLVVAKSTNHLDLHAKPLENNPVVSKPSALLAQEESPLQIQENIPTVNGEVRGDLVTQAGQVPDDWHPVVSAEVSQKKKSKSK